jgi:hypothetical protein
MDTEMTVALVFKLHGSDEHPLPDPVEWSKDVDNIVDFLLPYTIIPAEDQPDPEPTWPRKEVPVVGGQPQMSFDRVVLIGDAGD